MSGTLSDRYTASAGLGAGLKAHCASYGFDVEPLCASVGLVSSSFEDLTGRVSLNRFCRLLSLCAEKSGDEAFALKYSEVYPYGATGPFGYGLMVAPTVREVFRFQDRHMPYVSETSYCSFEEGTEEAFFSWRYSPAVLHCDQFVDMGLALILHGIKQLAGASADLIEVALERPPPRDFEPFRKFLSRNISFGQRGNCLRLPNSVLAKENPRADERLFVLMDVQCREFRPKLSEDGDIVGSLREFITTRLREEHVTLADAARFFGVSERSLQRRLAEHETSMNDVRDEVRRDMASRLLTETLLSASEICYRLGYSEPSVFTRSFHRWYGKSPSQYRKMRGKGAAFS